MESNRKSCWFNHQEDGETLLSLLCPMTYSSCTLKQGWLGISIISCYSPILVTLFHIELHARSLQPSLLPLTISHFLSGILLLLARYPSATLIFFLFLQHTSSREFAYAVLSGCNILPSFNCLHDYCFLFFFFFLIHITSSERPSLNGHSPLLFCLCLLHFSKNISQFVIMVFF